LLENFYADRSTQIRVPSILVAGLLSSVILIAFVIFFVAAVSGADAISAMPKWVWFSVAIYSGSAIGLAGRLSETAHNKDCS
jgi:uncharacterized RDD family membrane protein YckC